MKFPSFILALALAAKSNAQTSESPCLAACEMVDGVKECTFVVSRDQYASELGYFKFSGANGDCGGTNPVLGRYQISRRPRNRLHAGPLASRIQR